MDKNFSLEELMRSDIAERLGIINTTNDEVIISNINRLMDTLEVIRKLLGDKPIIVTSGYRSPMVNSAVRGSKNSAHLRGLAADIKVVGLKSKDVATLLVPNIKSIGLDQLIYEGSWVHVAIPAFGVKPRYQVLTAQFKALVPVSYVGGIV